MSNMSRQIDVPGANPKTGLNAEFNCAATGWTGWVPSQTQKPNAKNSPIFHVGVPTLDPTDRGNPRKFPPFHSVEKPIPRTLTMFCAVSEWFQGSSFQKNHGFWPPMRTVSLLYPLHTTVIIREHSYLFNSSSPFYQCLISRNFTIFCWGLTPCSIAKKLDVRVPLEKHTDWNQHQNSF